MSKGTQVKKVAKVTGPRDQDGNAVKSLVGRTLKLDGKHSVKVTRDQGFWIYVMHEGREQRVLRRRTSAFAIKGDQRTHAAPKPAAKKTPSKASKAKVAAKKDADAKLTPAQRRRQRQAEAAAASQA